MTLSVDEHVIKKLFSKFSIRYGSLWTSRLGTNGDWKECEQEWLDELIRFNLEHLKLAVKKALALYIEYPPTLGQLIHLCMKESGVPEVSDVIKLMVSREFNHPIVNMVYDKIGSWTLSNGSEKDIQSKARLAYDSCVADFHCDPKPHWEKLTTYNNQLKLEAPSPSKIPSASEIKEFRECMNKCQGILKGKKIACGGKTYKHFDENKIKKGHKEFDQAVFDEHMDYLISVPETETMILPPVYLMERNKFLNMRDQEEWLRNSGYIPPNERDGREAPRTSNGQPTRVYKNWAGE